MQQNNEQNKKDNHVHERLHSITGVSSIVLKPVLSLMVIDQPEPDFEEIYNVFTQWYAMPDIDRWEMLGVTEKNIQDKNHKAYRRAPQLKDFAEHFKVHRNTLSKWKNNADFANKVAYERLQWGKNLTANVIAALYRNIIKSGDPFAVELWLAYVEGWDKKQVVETVERYDIGDIRSILAALPPEEQKAFYGHITSAIQRAELYRRRGQIQTSTSQG